MFPLIREKWSTNEKWRDSLLYHFVVLRCFVTWNASRWTQNSWSIELKWYIVKKAGVYECDGTCCGSIFPRNSTWNEFFGHIIMSKITLTECYAYCPYELTSWVACHCAPVLTFICLEPEREGSLRVSPQRLTVLSPFIYHVWRETFIFEFLDNNPQTVYLTDVQFSLLTLPLRYSAAHRCL